MIKLDLSKIGIKPKDPSVAKKFIRVDESIDKREQRFVRFDRAITIGDLKNGEFALAKVKALSESPTSPSSDRLRLYYRNDGKLFKLEFTEV